MKACDLIRKLQNPPCDFRPVSFWFLNHFLEEPELRRQIAEQDEKGFGGVMCHARDGLRTAYLEDEWESAMRVIIEECEKRGMQVWLYDENHYPSGIAGGKIPKRFPGRHMLSLVPVFEDKVPQEGRWSEVCADGVHASKELNNLKYLLATGTSTGKTVNLLPCIKDGRLDWTNDLGEPALVQAMVERGYETNPVNHPDFSFYPDYLDEEVCRGFIEETHDWYAKRFEEHFGKTIQGIFTDNACAHFGHIRRSVPWSRELGERFTKSTGTPIEEVLPKLLQPLPGHREARLRFWRFFGDEFIRVFVGAINDWCKARGIHSTGHYCLEDGMGEHVRQIGSYFDVMRNQNLNAVDLITPVLWGIEGGEPLTACIRNTASAALFYGSPRVMCEAFGCCGGWGFDLREMRRIGGHLAALGIDLFVPHGLYYSIAGTRKYECIPDHLHHPMWKYYREWSDYAARLSLLTAGSDSLAEVAILYPVTTLQATLDLGVAEAASAASQPALTLADDSNLHAALGWLPGADRGADAERVRDLYDGLLDQLSQWHFSYEILAEDMLQSGNPDEGEVLNVPARGGRSRCRFKIVVLPGVQVVEAESLARLQAFSAKGGTVLCLGAMPTETYNPETGLLAPIQKPFLDGRVVVLGTNAKPADAVDFTCDWLRDHLPQPITVAGAGNGLASRAFAKDGVRFYLVHNSTDQAVTGAELCLRDHSEPTRLDLDQPALVRMPWQQQADTWRTSLDLAPGQSLLFVCGIADVPAFTVTETADADTVVTPVVGPWGFTTDRDNVIMLRQGTVKQNRSHQIYTYSFDVGAVPKRCRLLLDLEMTLPELNAGRYCNRLMIQLNGMELKQSEPGSYLDRYIREIEVADILCEGSNELIIAIAASLREDGHRLWPPILAGDFTAVRSAGGERLGASVHQLSLGDWTTQGYPDFAGEGCYRTTLRVPVGTAAWLDLGDLANACEVWVDGQCLGRRIAPPWRFAISAASREERELQVHVINTPNNLFETQPRPAGLFGPVRIWHTSCRNV